MTAEYAVIGNPIGHSKSPLIHTAFAKATGQDMAYVALECPPGGFDAAVDAFRRRGGRGLNVTTPFKLDAFAYATTLRDRARLAGAVNAMAFEDSNVVADNFDGVGLVRDIQHNLGIPIEGRQVLVLGAGGATRGALQPLLEQRPAGLVVANRTAAKANALAVQFSAYGAVTATALDRLAPGQRFDIVVNATSASLHGELPAVPPSVFEPGCLAYDMTYGKGLTPFLRLARSADADRLADGVGMLVEQAAEAFAWWRGVRPGTSAVIEAITVPLV